MEQWVSPEVKFSGRIFTVRAGGITLDDGTPAYREVVDHPGGVCVLPFDGTRVTLVRQYRIAVGEEVLEAVAGKLEPGDDPAQRARLELEEEAGIHAHTLVHVGEIFGCVGFCSERIFLYLALDLHYGIARPEAEERLQLESFTLDELKQLLASHKLKDAKTIVLLERLLRWTEQC